MAANMPKVHHMDMKDELTRCPDCDYDGGFHSIFVNEHTNGSVKWLLICPNCRSKYNVGLTALLVKPSES